MRGRKDSFLEWQTVCDPLAVIAFEEIIELNGSDRHQPDHSSEMPVASLRDPSTTFILAGLIHGWIQACRRDQFVMGFEVSYLASHLDQKRCCRLLPNPANRGQNLYIPLQTALAELNQGIGHLLQVLDWEKQITILPPDQPSSLTRIQRPNQLIMIQEAWDRLY